MSVKLYIRQKRPPYVPPLSTTRTSPDQLRRSDSADYASRVIVFCRSRSWTVHGSAPPFGTLNEGQYATISSGVHSMQGRSQIGATIEVDHAFVVAGRAREVQCNCIPLFVGERIPEVRRCASPDRTEPQSDLHRLRMWDRRSPPESAGCGWHWGAANHLHPCAFAPPPSILTALVSALIALKIVARRLFQPHLVNYPNRARNIPILQEP